jgi:predicted Zn-dependent peptidase
MLTNKWFGPIGKRNVKQRKLPKEPVQKEERRMDAERDVPASAIYKAWHTGPRKSKDFYVLDLITDLLAGGESGRLYTKLVREKKLFSEINAYITSDIDPGMMILHGRLMKGVDIQSAEESINQLIRDLTKRYPSDNEMEKVKNKFESSTIVSNSNILNKAMSLSYFELLGNPDLINNEIYEFRKTNKRMVAEVSAKYLNEENCSTLYYKSTRKD